VSVLGGAPDTFKYDPFGRRIYKSSSSGTSVFAYDGDNLIEETNSSGAVVARYEDTQNIDEPLAMLRSAATSYFHADGLGSISSLSNAAGSIANTYTYDSFGKLTASTGSLVNPFQYTARESDPETGLYYYCARYYDPNAGRFLSEDPLGSGGGINFYGYAGNSSPDLKDIFGLDYSICRSGNTINASTRDCNFGRHIYDLEPTVDARFVDSDLRGEPVLRGLLNERESRGVAVPGCPGWRRRRSLRTRLAWKVSRSSPWSFLGSRSDFCCRWAVGTMGVCHPYPS